MLPIGKIPDILIPAIDPYYHQTTNAFPINVAAGNTQSVWVDVHIPPNAPSGYYKGTVTVQKGCSGPYPSTGCSTITSLPIILAVWQWPNAGSMPSKATLRSYHVEGDGVCQQYYGQGYLPPCDQWPGAGGDVNTAISIAKKDFATLYLDHRLQGPNQMYTTPGSALWNTYYVPLMNGTADTILPGAKVNTFMWSNDGGTLQQWATTFQTGGWSSTLFNYSCDEPGPNGGCGQKWANIYNNVLPLHALTPPMPALVTTSFPRIRSGNGSGQTEAQLCSSLGQPADCIENSIDWLIVNVADMANTEHANIAAYHTWVAGSSYYGTPPKREWWSYQACDSTACGSQKSSGGSYDLEGPSYTLDTTPIDNRVSAWFEQYTGQTGDLYFNDEICWGNTGCGSGNGDPWLGVNYGGTQGDGTLVYPGRQIGTPTGFHNVGVTIPLLLPSVRLKHMRDGMQDYEIMNVLNAHGKNALVLAAINSFMVTNNGITGGNSGNWSFNNTLAPVPGVFTSDLPDARQSLGTAMHQLTSWSGSAPSPCDVNGDGTINVADVQLEVNMALGINPCTNPSGVCTVVSVQRVANAALGGTCVSP
jgi:hypothetical protein